MSLGCCPWAWIWNYESENVRDCSCIHRQKCIMLLISRTKGERYIDTSATQKSIKDQQVLTSSMKGDYSPLQKHVLQKMRYMLQSGLDQWRHQKSSPRRNRHNVISNLMQIKICWNGIIIMWLRGVFFPLEKGWEF